MIISRSQSVIDGVIASVFRHKKRRPGYKTQAGVHSAKPDTGGRGINLLIELARSNQLLHAPYGAEPYPASNGQIIHHHDAARNL